MLDQDMRSAQALGWLKLSMVVISEGHGARMGSNNSGGASKEFAKELICESKAKKSCRKSICL